MSLTEDDLDVSGYDPDKLDRGENVEPGWYLCTIEDVSEDAKFPGTLIFKLKIIQGKYEGYQLTERLFHPSHAADTDKAEFARKRRAIFATRLGLATKEQFAAGTARISWVNAISEECVVKVSGRKYTDKDGNQKEGVQVEYAGIYSRNHEKVPAELRTGPPPAAEGSNGSSSEAKPKPAAVAKAKPPAQKAIDYRTL